MARILAVDDEPIVRRAVVRALGRLGHAVTEAADGTTAVRLAQEVPFDVALVDFNLRTGPDGLEVLARLRELAPRCVRVLMTGRTDFPLIVQAVNEGEIFRVLSKPFHAGHLTELLDAAVEAGRRLAVLDDVERDAHGAERLFREVVGGGHLRLALQPIVAAADGRTAGVECLLRSTHPLLPGASALLRLAERANRVHELGRAVNALAARWAERLPDDILLFVNIHPAQLDDLDVVAGFEPLVPYAERVVVEITERASLRDVTRWELGVARLEALGFRFAIDDLGSGYGGLSLLADLRPAFIKIDMSIVRDVHEKPNKQRLVDVMATFANATGAKLVAEGIESEAEAAALVRSGAHLLQGYLFGRPRLGWPE